MGKIRTFRDLVAWQRADALAVEVYRLTSGWSFGDLISLGSQMRRSAGSVADNIAEGFGVGTRPGFLRHLRIARGSLCEFESQAGRAETLGWIGEGADVGGHIRGCQRLLQALITSIERSPRPGPGPSAGGRIAAA